MIGGGGLIQLPALLLLFPAMPFVTISGTNKFSSMCGTSMAIFQYSRKIVYSKKLLINGAITALIFSFLGFYTMSHINNSVMRPLVIILLLFIAIYTFFRKDLGNRNNNSIPQKAQLALFFITAIIGFYDGFFGPGTGSFLIFSFIIFLNMDFLRASASAKVINFSTNFAAVIYAATTSNINYNIAIPMALSNIAGAIVGTRIAIKFGTKLIRILFILIVCVMLVKLLIEQFKIL